VLHTFGRDSGYQDLEIIGYWANAVLRVLRSGTEWVEDLGVCVLGLDGHVIGCGYADASDAGEGVIAVADAERRWGAIDHAGHVLFAPRYKTGESLIYRDARMNIGRSSPFRFKGNYAELRTVYSDRLPFYIDKAGREFRDVAAPHPLRTSRWNNDQAHIARAISLIAYKEGHVGHAFRAGLRCSSKSVRW